MIKERERAQRIYDSAKREGRKASLMSQERPNVFTTSVANIPPKGAIEVVIEYQQTLRFDSGQFSLRFPMVVGPRYIAGTDPIAGDPGTGWANNTSEVPDAARITPPVVKGGTNPVSMEVMLNSGFPLARVESNYHELERAECREYQYCARLTDTPANRDFELTWAPEAGREAEAAMLLESRGGSHYALFMLMPPAQPLEHTMPREVIFVIDTSGSMHGASLAQAKDALQLAVSRLKGTDAFNIIQFNSTTHELFTEPRRADRDSIPHALNTVGRLEANGGTEMFPTLRAAFAQKHDPARVRQIVFLTDGAVGNEEQLFELIRERLGESRLFMIGIGSAPNSFFMKKAAEFGRGTFTYIGKVEEVQAKMGALFSKLERPALTGIEIGWPGEAEMSPRKVPDLYFGEPIVVAARLHQIDGVVTVEGKSGGIRWRSDVPLAAAASDSGIHVLWARSKIESLTNAERENPDAIRKEIVELGMARLLAAFLAGRAVAPARRVCRF